MVETQGKSCSPQIKYFGTIIIKGKLTNAQPNPKICTFIGLVQFCGTC